MIDNNVVTELVRKILNQALERVTDKKYNDNLRDYIYKETKKLLIERISQGGIDDNELEAFLIILS